VVIKFAPRWTSLIDLHLKKINVGKVMFVLPKFPLPNFSQMPGDGVWED
jgi:hypothetical protein